MEDFLTDQKVVIEIGMDKIQKGLEKAADDLFKSSYGNPMQELLKKSIEEKHGEIKKIVDGIVSDAIGNPEFKTKISEVVIQRMVAAALDNQRR